MVTTSSNLDLMSPFYDDITERNELAQTLLDEAHPKDSTLLQVNTGSQEASRVCRVLRRLGHKAKHLTICGELYIQIRRGAPLSTPLPSPVGRFDMIKLSDLRNPGKMKEHGDKLPQPFKLSIRVTGHKACYAPYHEFAGISYLLPTVVVNLRGKSYHKDARGMVKYLNQFSG